MPTLTLSFEDCEYFRTDLNRFLSKPEVEAPLLGMRVDYTGAIERLGRFHAALDGAVTVGTFDPAIALTVLDDVNNSSSKPLMLLIANLTPEKIEHVMRLHACGLIAGHRDHQGVQASGLTAAGQTLRTFLACWSSVVLPRTLKHP